MVAQGARGGWRELRLPWEVVLSPGVVALALLPGTVNTEIGLPAASGSTLGADKSSVIPAASSSTSSSQELCTLSWPHSALSGQSWKEDFLSAILPVPHPILGLPVLVRAWL